ncbi:unnamed protein product [marine sediment metagenome]|uniref:Uncharacterized protein n=1 Tax=marine sediment metagenome TaxID=412755 RepID=X1R0C2_9ZZZZ
MPVEILDDIVEELADKFGIYGVGPQEGDLTLDFMPFQIIEALAPFLVDVHFSPP